MIAALSFLRAVSPRQWMIVAIAAGVFAVAVALYLDGRADERRAQEARQAKAEARASINRETAASDRTLDNAAIVARQKERDDAAEDLPDSPPDDRELRRRCRQLRDAGRDLPACRVLAGPVQARPAG
jgi:hypothetical protein